MFAIYKRELKNYFINMTGYVFTGIMLIMTGVFMTILNLIGGYPAFENSLSSVILVLLFIVPILTMRSISEERRAKTDQLLYSLPVSISGVVIAKYLAMFTVFLVPVAVMCFYPLILSIFGTVYFGASYSAILGFALLGAALIAVGMFMSSLTESQVIAAVTTAGVLLAMYLMNALATLIPASALASLISLAVVVILFSLVVYGLTKNWTVAGITAAVGGFLLIAVYLIDKSVFAGLFPDILTWLSAFERFSNFINGMFDLTSVVYYLSLAALFVFATIQSVEKRRWS